MRNFEQCSLAEALSAWGHHEAMGRCKASLPPDLDVEDPIVCVSLALSFRSMFIARILASEPVITLRGLVSAREIQSLQLADGRMVSEWATSNSQSGSEGWRAVEAMRHGSSVQDGAWMKTLRSI